MPNPANDKDVMDRVNKKIYESAHVLKHYDTIDFIIKPEQTLLRKLLPLIKDKKILDIGVGGGRTTKFLLEISRDYTGIDYSPGFVELVKEKYKNADVRCCDARDLKIFRDNSFDFILFSLNGIDYITHEDRIKALKEIYRVLKPDGFFMFSTHNRDYRYFNKLPWQEKARFKPGYLKSCLYSLYYLPKHLNMKKHHRCMPQYAIINDNAHGYSMLTYYINISEQVKQLEDVGFGSIEAYDMEGNIVNRDNSSVWIYYLANSPKRNL